MTQSRLRQRVAEIGYAVLLGAPAWKWLDK